MEPAIFYWLKKVRGSISAEHGIGFAKANYLNTTRDESVIQVMKQVKDAIDPKGILNPYKIIGEDYYK